MDELSDTINNNTSFICAVQSRGSVRDCTGVRDNIVNQLSAKVTKDVECFLDMAEVHIFLWNYQYS